MRDLFGNEPENLRVTQDFENYEEIFTQNNQNMSLIGNFADNSCKAKLKRVWIPKKSSTVSGYSAVEVPFLDLAHLEVIISDEKVEFAESNISNEEVDLDFTNGLLTRSFILKTKVGEVKFNFQRFLSIDRPELFVERLKIESLFDKPVEIEINSSISPLYNEETELKDWEVLKSEINGATSKIIMVTSPTEFATPRFLAGSMAHHLTNLRSGATTNHKPLSMSNNFRGNLLLDDPVFFEKRVVTLTSFDHSSDKDISDNLEYLSNEIDNFNFSELLSSSTDEYTKLRDSMAVKIEGNSQLQQVLNYGHFQLQSNLTQNSALSWLHEALFIPFLLESGHFAKARHILHRRFLQIELMKKNARNSGARGILVPDQTMDGSEDDPDQDVALFGVYRNAVLAWAIQQYMIFTDDQKWFEDEGKELLKLINDFWLSRIQYSAYEEKYMLLSVTGPDSYEFNVDNNWVTNYLVKWNLSYTLSVLADQLDDDTTKFMKKIIDEMFIPEVTANKQTIYPQDDSFFNKNLDEVASRLPVFERPLNEHWSKDHLAREAYLKRPDVLWGFYFFPDDFSKDLKKGNFNFYYNYLLNETPESQNFTALGAALTGQDRLAIESVDVSFDPDVMTNACGHLIFSRGFLGLTFIDGIPNFVPQFPEELLSYRTVFHFRNNRLAIEVDLKQLTITNLDKDNLVIFVNDESYELKLDKPLIIDRS